MKRNLIAILLLSLLAAAATADTSDFEAEDTAGNATGPAVEPWHFHVYVENDARYLKPNNHTDRWYTNGVAISAAWHPEFAGWFAGNLELLETFDAERTAFGFTAGQLMFTPGDITEPSLIVDDRPYAGYLYGGVFLQRSNAHTFDHVQLDLGIVGHASLAEAAQKFVHHMLPDSPHPEGWRNQLRDEVTVQLTARRKWRLDLIDRDPAEPGFGLQVIPHVELALGSVHRYAEAGVMARVGWRLPDDFGPGRLAMIGDATGKLPDGWSVYVYSGVSGRAVEHNLFLDGNNYRNSHSVAKEPLVGRWDIGAAIQFRATDFVMELGYAQTYMTEEFKEQDEYHSFGAITVKLIWLF